MEAKARGEGRDSTGVTNVLLGHCVGVGWFPRGLQLSERKPTPGHTSWWLRCPEPLQPGSGSSAKSVIADTCPELLPSNVHRQTGMALAVHLGFPHFRGHPSQEDFSGLLGKCFSQCNPEPLFSQSPWALSTEFPYEIMFGQHVLLIKNKG